ncbi:MAG: exopolyphosphatase [Candidatus Marinimicrobia bacterium]|nr:exopolyphosphatase [Candidatus Neomarinimicrobiota bacterium]
MPKNTKKFRVEKRDPRESWIPDSSIPYAAIDIGSNGVRLLLSRVMTSGEYCVFTKESLVRMPIRLGEDVFSQGQISEEKADQLVSTMTAFAHLLKAYKPEDYLAYATSAMREASNGKQICKRIRQESGLNLEIINGGQEAEVIFASHIAESMQPDRAYLYIDVGGGSTELTFFAQGQRLISKSFPIGTVRLLNKQVESSSWTDMQSWVDLHQPEDLELEAIGSGGNMNKMFRLANKASGKPIAFTELIEIDALLNSYSMEERIRIMHLRPDRADVIVHASKIFRTIMEWGNIKNIYVPQFGLADGLVHLMHDEYARKQKNN